MIHWQIKDNDVDDCSDFQDEIHEVVDRCIPIYIAEVFEIASNNLGLNHRHRDSELGYPEDADPCRILQINMYDELYKFVISNIDDWFEAVKEELENEK